MGRMRPPYPPRPAPAVRFRLSSFEYYFRRLTWREELAVKFDPKIDRRKALLAQALDNVSGFPIQNPQEAMEVLAQMPSAVFDRIWIIYRADLPENRYYEIPPLYKAPDARRFSDAVNTQHEQNEELADKAIEQLEKERQNTEDQEIQQQIFKNAFRDGKIKRARQ